jgi:hypothetical protein
MANDDGGFGHCGSRGVANLAEIDAVVRCASEGKREPEQSNTAISPIMERYTYLNAIKRLHLGEAGEDCVDEFFP